MQPDWAKLTDPEYLVAEAKYANSRYAIGEAYKIAARRAYVQDTEVPWVDAEGRSQIRYLDPTPEQLANRISSVARLLAVEIEADLNNTLKLMEATNGPKADPSKLS